MSITINYEAVLFAAVYNGLEAEGIRPCKIMSQYNVLDHRFLVRVDHVPTKTTVTHGIYVEDMTPGQLAEKLVNPIVTKMLEVLTS